MVINVDGKNLIITGDVTVAKVREVLGKGPDVGFTLNGVDIFENQEKTPLKAGDVVTTRVAEERPLTVEGAWDIFDMACDKLEEETGEFTRITEAYNLLKKNYDRLNQFYVVIKAQHVTRESTLRNKEPLKDTSSLR